MTSKIVVNNIEADAGVSTVTFNSNVETGSSNLHSTGLNVNNTFVHSTGIALGAGSTIGAVTGVTTYYGDGSQLTGISAGVSLANGADNRVVTATGAAALNGESGVTYDGTDFTIGSGRISLTDESSGAQFKLGTGSDFQIEHDGSNSYIYNLTNDLLIQCDNNVEITAKTGGTKRFRFDSDGLKFGSDTAAANALDDYEEGTFTPTARGNNTNSSPVISGSGKYTKIGNVVQIQLSFAAENGTYLPSGEYFQIHGLPFTFNGEHFIPYGFNYKVVFNSSYQYLFYSPSGNTRLDGYINVSDSPYTPWGTDQWDNTQWYHSNSFSYLTS